MQKQNKTLRARQILSSLVGGTIILLLLVLETRGLASRPGMTFTAPMPMGKVSQAFEQASSEFHVPVALLKAICYLEGRMSNNEGDPSVDNGFGCMHLVKNEHGDLLDRAARESGLSANQLRADMSSNIRGGAALLRDDALQFSSTHRLPANLADWYGAVAAYSEATTRSTALLYAEAVYTILDQGFSVQADDGETITLPPQRVHPDLATAAAVKGSGKLPAGCKLDQKVDYTGAVDCMLPAHTFDCNITPTTACSFTGSNRPDRCTIDYSPTNIVKTKPCAIDQIVIHDIEGSAYSALNRFQNPQAAGSAHYIVDGDGTIYQVVREKDIAYHDGNFWYNQHSIGIEHTGYDATGYHWYNASEYLASAKLVAYLLKKYQLPLDRAHIVAHATVPSPSATSLPNHVDPGPYWLWDYYFQLIHEQGVEYPTRASVPNVFMLRPRSDRHPFGKHGRETSANFNFFYLYNGPSTASGRIPQQNDKSDITDITNCIEPDVSYYYLAKVADPAGNGDTMYKIWYGVEDQAHSAQPGLFAHARTVWLAVPRGAASSGEGTAVTLHAAKGQRAPVYGEPTTDKKYIIGDAPDGAIFVSGYSLTEDNSSNLWYEIDYNHRQGWVPASEVKLMQDSPGQ